MHGLSPLFIFNSSVYISLPCLPFSLSRSLLWSNRFISLHASLCSLYWSYRFISLLLCICRGREGSTMAASPSSVPACCLKFREGERKKEGQARGPHAHGGCIERATKAFEAAKLKLQVSCPSSKKQEIYGHDLTSTHFFLFVPLGLSLKHPNLDVRMYSRLG